MRLSFVGFILILLSIQIVQTQYWNPSSSYNRCYGQYEQYSQCASTCPDTCEDIRRPNPMKICTLMCRTGCECMKPFVRSSRYSMSPCVHPFQMSILPRLILLVKYFSS